MAGKAWAGWEDTRDRKSAFQGRTEVRVRQSLNEPRLQAADRSTGADAVHYWSAVAQKG